MTDPRLNSVHLDDARRQDFRRARDLLLNARGMQTLAGENVDRDAWPNSNPHTLLQNQNQRVPPELQCWLADREFIYPLHVGLNTIGRAPDNDVVVADSYVSRRHCAILVHAGDGCEVHDVASKNGTFLNGKKLTGPTPINPGDQITMCDRQFTFMSQEGAQKHPGHMPTQTE